jgi:phosphoribosylformylglycinamidine synthase
VLFGEDASRIVISLPPAGLTRLEQIAKQEGATLIQLGAVGGDRLEIQGALSVDVSELGTAWRDGIPRVLKRATSHFPPTEVIQAG